MTKIHTSPDEIERTASSDVIIDDRGTQWRHQSCQQLPIIPIAL